MSPAPTMALRAPIACDMFCTPGIPDATAAVRALVTSTRSAWPTVAPSAATFTRFRAFVPVMPIDEKFDSTWYSASASESGLCPTSPARLRTPSLRDLIWASGTPACVLICVIAAWKAVADLIDS